MNFVTVLEKLSYPPSRYQSAASEQSIIYRQYCKHTEQTDKIIHTSALHTASEAESNQHPTKIMQARKQRFRAHRQERNAPHHAPYRGDTCFHPPAQK